MQRKLKSSLVGSLVLVIAVVANCSASDQKNAERAEEAGAAGEGTSPNSGGAPSSGGAQNGAGTSSNVPLAGAPSGEAGAGGFAGVSTGGAPDAGGASADAGAPSGEGGASGAAVGGQGGANSVCCDPVVTYQASSSLLPSDVCQAWTLIDNAAPEEALLNGGYLHIETSADGENLYYQHGAANLTVPATLTVEARMKLTSGSGAVAHRGPAGLGVSYGPTHQKNLLFIAAGEIFILSGENVKGAAAAVATTDDFHVYKMVFDTTQNTVEVFYDGVSKLTGSTFVDPSAAPSYVYFGEATSFGHGSSDWDYVTHNAYTCAPE